MFFDINSRAEVRTVKPGKMTTTPVEIISSDLVCEVYALPADEIAL
jgi:hypothetical protein